MCVGASCCPVNSQSWAQAEEANADGQDILRLSALLYIIPEANVVPDWQINFTLSPDIPQVAGPRA